MTKSRIFLVLRLPSLMDKIAAISINIKVTIFEASTFLGFILWIVLIICSELIKAMRKFTSVFVRAEAFHKIFAKLRPLFFWVGFRWVFSQINTGLGSGVRITFLLGSCLVVYTECGLEWFCIHGTLLNFHQFINILLDVVGDLKYKNRKFMEKLKLCISKTQIRLSV